LPLMLEISKSRDIYVTQTHYFGFPENMDTPITIVNDNKVINSYGEYYDTYIDMAVKMDLI